MQWLPFVVPEILGFDYRWVPYTVFFIGIFLLLKLVVKGQHSLPMKVLITLSPFFILYQLSLPHEGYITHIVLTQTIELLNVGYYLILGYGVITSTTWLTSTGLILTVLSRFSLLFWVPAYLGAVFFKESKKKALGIGISVLLGVIFLYVIPFLSKDWAAFQHGLDHYSRTTVSVWEAKTPPEMPRLLKNDLGMVPYFFPDSVTQIEQQIAVLKRTQILSIIGISLLGFLFYFLGKSKASLGYYFVCLLMMYLACFYAFVQLPYSYLYLLPLFWSIFVLAISD